MAGVAAKTVEELREELPTLPWPSEGQVAAMVSDLERRHPKRCQDVACARLEVLVQWPRPAEHLMPERRVARERSRFGPEETYTIDVPRPEWRNAPLPADAFAVAARLACGWFVLLAGRGDVALDDVQIRVQWAEDGKAFGDVFLRAVRR